MARDVESSAPLAPNGSPCYDTTLTMFCPKTRILM